MSEAQDALLDMHALRSENVKLRQEIERLRATSAPLQDSHPRTCSCAHAWSHKSNVQLNTHEAERYSRQIVLQGFGPQAQEKVCHGSVLIIGAGGLGCPCAMYLSAAGVGRIGLVDKDVVSLDNLHRQIAHRESTVGVHKATSAAATCSAINSAIRVHAHCSGLTPENAVELCEQYDVVVDCSDNAPTRYVVNDASVIARKPLVSGAAVGFDGQLTVYSHQDGPCYRCLFPECPAADTCSRCEDAGVLGVVPGVIGTLQALEALKILSGVGTPLSGTLLLFDALSSRFRSIKLRPRRDSCPACGEASELRACGGPANYDYASFTGGQAMVEAAAPVSLLRPEQRITVVKLAEQLQLLRDQGNPFLLLDVRPDVQFATTRLDRAVNIPLQRTQHHWQEVLDAVEGHPPDAPKFVICRKGNDSQVVADKLIAEGVQNVKDVLGGMTAWAKHVDTTVPIL